MPFAHTDFQNPAPGMDATWDLRTYQLAPQVGAGVLFKVGPPQMAKAACWSCSPSKPGPKSQKNRQARVRLLQAAKLSGASP